MNVMRPSGLLSVAANAIKMSKMSLSGYVFPKPIWSMNVFEDRILAKQQENKQDIINEEGVRKLAKLAGIDLEAARDKVSAEEIMRDVNVILNCANFLQVRYY
jgi:hypothetical protein